MSKNSQLKAGAILSYINLAISTLIPLCYTPIMLRLLGQAEYGLYSLSNSVISYLSLLTFGLGSTIQRYYMQAITAGDKKRLEEVVGLFTILYAIIAFVTLIGGALTTLCTGTLFAEGLSVQENDKLNVLIRIMSVSAAVSLLAVPFVSIVVSYERYIFQRTVTIVSTVAVPILNLIVLYAGYASAGMALVGVGIQVVTLVIDVWYSCRFLGIWPKFLNLPFNLLREVFAFTAYVFIAMIADILYWSTDKVLIGALVGSTAVAVYNVGVTFQAMLQQLSSAISGVFGPRVNHLVFSGAPISQISELMIRVGRVQYLIVSLAMSGFITFGRAFLHLWVGAGYEEAYDIALLTMIPAIIPLIQNIAFNTIVAQNRHQFRSVLYVVLAIANAASTYLLIPVMGIIGAAFCTFVVFLIGHGLIINWFYKKHVGLDIIGFWKNIGYMTIVPAVMVCAGIWVQNNGITFTTLKTFAVGVLIYSGVFCVFSWFVSMNQYEKDLIRLMAQRLFSWLRLTRVK